MKNKRGIKLSAEDEDAIIDSLKCYMRDELEPWLHERFTVILEDSHALKKD